MKRRPTSLEPRTILHRRRPVSIAVSLALIAAATAAAASEGAGAPAPQDALATPPPPDQITAEDVTTITITGVRASQMRAIEVKRAAPSIQDSISAESIGQLPDVTITDALQRITGVQINRDAGVGTSVDVRGLPQVGSMLNGEVFITPDQIDSQQPAFTTLPATLFNQVDVIKSTTAGQTESGISGALNLHTFRPWDLPRGFTYSYVADGERGSTTRKNGPEANGLISYNADGRWGLLVSADFSDTTRMNANEGLDSYGVIFHGENAASAAAYNGFVSAWSPTPLPSQITQNPDGSVDVNGDGKSNGVFMGSEDINLFNISTERKRWAANASFQADFDHGLTLTSDYFYAHQTEWDRNVGIQFNSTVWQGATYVPVNARDTGSTALSQYNTPPQDPNWAGSHVFATSVYEKWPGDVESYSQVTRLQSTTQNLNVQLDFNNGGPFRWGVRGIRETAKQGSREADVNISDSDGCLATWIDSTSTLPCGTYVYPAQLGGNRVFNPIGIPQNTIPVTADFTGRYLTVSMPAALASNFANPNGWTFKTIEATDPLSYDRETAITALRFDGHFDINKGFHLNFGARNSIRSASNYAFTLITPVYGGIGATNPDGTPNSTGCWVRYAGADVILGGNATYDSNGNLVTPNTWCTAGNSGGNVVANQPGFPPGAPQGPFFRGGPLSALPLSKTPPPLANNFREYANLLGSGITFWAIDPYAMDDPEGYFHSLYPNTTRQEAPGNTWAVSTRETATYLQGDFSGELGSMSYSGNVGARVVHTVLHISQHLAGLPGQYGLENADNGIQVTERSYNDVLPAVNLSLNMTEKLTVRLSASKNMMPLNLSEWGGGLTLGYSLAILPTGGQLYEVSQGSSSGNPSLNPWRSKNYGASFEYYINSASMVNLELFRINVDSFIKTGSVINCTYPDQDGVVRNRCIAITEPLQGSGNSIQGAEFDYRQGFTFLPGLLANTGMEVNFTYAPSDTGETDLAGHKIPFQDNSTESGNLILWYQDKHFQARLAYNYRSRRAVLENEGGIQGLEQYEAPQKYLDASIAYKVNKYAEVFVDGTNLTNEYQRYYIVWPDQASHSTFSERMYTLGVRGQW